MPQHNLLTDPIVGVRRPGGTVERLSLPEVFAALSGNGLDGFAALAAHQRQGWYCLLVQLAALALHRADLAEPPADGTAWAGLLRGLTPDAVDDQPWCLLVEDPARPAFLQPPVHRSGLDVFRNRIDTPDGLDLLITAKNHDVKVARLTAPAAEHWLYALVNLQTMQGFLGRGNYGIMRMNGGFASRPRVGRAPQADWGTRFRRDLAVLRDGRAEVLASYDLFPAAGGLALLWLEPWDEEEALPLGALDPWCIEVCRRVRLTAEGGRIVALTRPSNTPRIDTRETNGAVGDPWVPLDAKGAALTVGPSGLDYRLLARLIAPADGHAALAQRRHPEDPAGDALLTVEVLVRGQGRTEGLHERVIPIPASARHVLDFEPERVGEAAARQVEGAAALRLKVLKPALLTLAQGGPKREDLDYTDERANPWLDRFDRLVDGAFFPALWRSLEDEESRSWDRALVRQGRALLREAEAAMAIPTARRHRAMARAETLYDGAVRRIFPDLHPPRDAADGRADDHADA